MDAVRGPPGGTEGLLGGLGGGDLDENCFSVEWNLQEVVPRLGKPITRAAAVCSLGCRSTGGKRPELRVDRST